MTEVSSATNFFNRTKIFGKGLKENAKYNANEYLPNSMKFGLKETYNPDAKISAVLDMAKNYPTAANDVLKGRYLPKADNDQVNDDRVNDQVNDDRVNDQVNDDRVNDQVNKKTSSEFTNNENIYRFRGQFLIDDDDDDDKMIKSKLKSQNLWDETAMSENTKKRREIMIEKCVNNIISFDELVKAIKTDQLAVEGSLVDGGKRRKTRKGKKGKKEEKREKERKTRKGKKDKKRKTRKGRK